jgi:hypothetical protein
MRRMQRRSSTAASKRPAARSSGWKHDRHASRSCWRAARDCASWAAPPREEIRQHNGHAGAPCVGWLCDEVAAYGRGVHPIDVQGAMSVMALGDPAREGERLG